jgi:hypothetical protein
MAAPGVAAGAVGHRVGMQALLRRTAGAIAVTAVTLLPLAATSQARADVGVVTFVYYSGPDGTGRVLGTEDLVPLPGDRCDDVALPPGTASFSVTNYTVQPIEVDDAPCSATSTRAATAAVNRHNIPQLVMLTFDDAVNVLNYEYYSTLYSG